MQLHIWGVWKIRTPGAGGGGGGRGHRTDGRRALHRTTSVTCRPTINLADFFSWSPGDHQIDIVSNMWKMALVFCYLFLHLHAYYKLWIVTESYLIKQWLLCSQRLITQPHKRPAYWLITAAGNSLLPLLRLLGYESSHGPVREHWRCHSFHLLVRAGIKDSRQMTVIKHYLGPCKPLLTIWHALTLLT